MRLRIFLSLTAAMLLGAPAAAQADFPHVVAPGESLYSIAAADGLSVGQLAAANGLSTDAQLILGTTLMIPPQSASGATGSATTAVGATGGDGDHDSDDPGGAAGASTPASAGGASSSQTGGGSYIVQPGDTLSGIAARAGTTVGQLASANGLNPNAYLLIGTVLTLSGSGGAVGPSAASSQPVGPTAEGSPTAPPYPTPERLSASAVGSVASANGVPAPLAKAIGWQESGFNNDLVSPAGARGVMQILPGTWAWVNQTMAGGTLGPASAVENVRGGVLLLHSLLNATGGNQALAAAGYYQGLPSVLAHGMYSDTQQYVNDVMSLEHQFGGW